MSRVVVGRRKMPSPPKAESPPPPSGVPLIYQRSQSERRIMALELFAWAIVKAEACDTPEKLLALLDELQATRRAEWGERPWNGATRRDDFVRHMTSLATSFAANRDEFTYSGARYGTRDPTR